jgi:hypothetical protein
MIEREQAAKLYAVYQRAFDVLCEAYEVLGSLPDGPERDEAVHGETTDAVLFGLRARILIQYPELEASIPEEPSDAAHDPLDDVLDEDLIVDAGMLVRLSAFRRRAKLVDLPGVDPTAERARLSDTLNHPADTLLEGLVANPTKLWAMRQFQRSLVRVENEDTEGKGHFGTELETIMGILAIESSDVRERQLCGPGAKRLRSGTLAAVRPQAGADD